MAKIDSKQNAIEVRGLYKTFRLPHEQHSGLKQFILNFLKRKHDRGYETQEVLKDISFDVKKGDFFGIVGRNGSGKSTLLKLISGIYTPDQGGVTIHGSLTPFIELGVGFNPELTGRENVFLNGALLGFSADEVEQMYDEIVKFAELERFMDQKLKNYSSGMQVRLAFSIAIRAETDILILDEVLAVGDESFQRKCYQYFAHVRSKKQTVILVTHSMDMVQQFCNRAMLIDKGHKAQIGNPLQIAQIYRELNSQGDTVVNTGHKKSDKQGTEHLRAKIDYCNKGSELEFNILIWPKKELIDPIVAIEMFRNEGEQVYRWVTDEKINEQITLTEGKETKIKLSIQNIFPVGSFSVRLLVRKRDRSMDYAIINDAVRFEIKNTTTFSNNIHWKPKEKYVIHEKINNEKK